MDFQTCAVELVQTQFHEAVAAYVSGTPDNCPSDLLAYYVQSLWNITMKNISIMSDIIKIRRCKMYKNQRTNCWGETSVHADGYD